MFWMRNKENNFPIPTLIWRPVTALCTLVIWFLINPADQDPHIFIHKMNHAECSGSFGREIVWGSKGCLFEPQRQQNHCVVSVLEHDTLSAA